MPSPGKTTISACMVELLWRMRRKAAVFETGDGELLLEQVTELVDALQQAGLRESIEREFEAAAIGQGYAACGDVDAQFDAGLIQQLVDDDLVEHDRQQ